MSWLRLHVSNLCNFKCPNCHVFELGENDLPNRVMSQDIFDKSIEVFIDSLNHLAQEKVTISIYGGETLANKKVIKQGIEKFGASYRGIEITWVINTNGSLLKEEDVHFFKEQNVEIHISVDGKEEVHNISRPTHKGKGTFHMVEPALNLIKMHKVPSQINSYMMPSNYNHLKDLVDIAEKYNISKIYLDQFYNLDMITHKVGMEKYMSVYLYGLKKGILINGPWNRVIRNYQNNESREFVLRKSLSLDVNIDGSCYFPVYSESKAMGFHIDSFSKFIKRGGWNEITEKTITRNISKCNECSIQNYCNGVAIEQVHYHIGLEADTKVSCDFFRDWCQFLMRPVYFKRHELVDYVSMIELSLVEPMIKKINEHINLLEKKLWPLNHKVVVNFLEHHEEILMASKMESLPNWTTAITKDSTLYLRGTILTPAIIHELSHIFLNQENVKAPKWFLEGVCEWIQNKKIDPKLLSKSLKEKNLFSLIEKAEGNDIVLIDHDDQKPGRNSLYVQAHAFVDFLEKIMGKELLKLMILETSQASLTSVLESFTGLSLIEMINNFLESSYFITKVSRGTLVKV